MREKSYSLWFFSVYETDALAEYLEKKDAAGWHLEKVSASSFFQFRKAQPRRRKYCVTIVPGSSELEGRDRDEALRYREYCEDAGWELEYRNYLWQIYSTSDENLIAIETDPAIRLETIRHYLFLPLHLAAYGVLELLFLTALLIILRNPVELLASWSRFLCALVLLGTVLLFPGILLHNFLWYRKRMRQIKAGGTFSRTGFCSVKRKTYIQMTAFTLVFVVLSMGTGEGSLLYFPIQFAGAAARICLCSLILALVREKSSGSAGEKVFLYILAACIIVGAFNFIFGKVSDGFLGNGREVSVTKAYAVSDFPDVLGAAGFKTDDLTVWPDERTVLAGYQRAYGNCVAPSGEESHVLLKYYRSHVSGAINWTLCSKYPANHGNMWEITETFRRSDSDSTVVKYEYNSVSREAGSGDGQNMRTLYLMYTEHEILSLDFGSEGDDSIISVLESWNNDSKRHD